MFGQIRRVKPVEVNSGLPPLRNREIYSVIGSLFAGSLFFVWALNCTESWEKNSKWIFTPWVLFFAFLASGTHKYL